MRHALRLAIIAPLFTMVCGSVRAQDIPAIEQLWQQTVSAEQRGQDAQARSLFAQFNQAVRSYVEQNGNSWQIEYLVGSLNCQFPESRASGTLLLRDVLQTERDLNSSGEARVAASDQSMQCCLNLLNKD